jgi:hypothetical protein
MSLLRSVILRSKATHIGLLRSKRTFATGHASSKRKRLVILGSGWGGYQVLKGAHKLNYGPWSCTCPQLRVVNLLADVTMISPSTYFNFTPLLASCAVGTLEYRCAIEPVGLSVIRAIAISNVDKTR